MLFDRYSVLEIENAMLFMPILLINQALDAKKLKLVRAEGLHLLIMGLAISNGAFIQALVRIIILLRIQIVFTV